MPELIEPKVYPVNSESLKLDDPSVVLWDNSQGRLLVYFDHRFFRQNNLDSVDAWRLVSAIHEQMYNGAIPAGADDSSQHFMLRFGGVKSSDKTEIAAAVKKFVDEVFRVVQENAAPSPEPRSADTLPNGNARSSVTEAHHE